MDWLIRILGGYTQEEVSNLEEDNNKETRKNNSRLEKLKSDLIVIGRERKNEYNRAQKYYIRCRRGLDFIKDKVPKATPRITRKHIYKLNDILDGADIKVKK